MRQKMFIYAFASAAKCRRFKFEPIPPVTKLSLGNSVSSWHFSRWAEKPAPERLYGHMEHPRNKA
jgi:hypothetical protein